MKRIFIDDIIDGVSTALELCENRYDDTDYYEVSLHLVDKYYHHIDGFFLMDIGNYGIILTDSIGNGDCDHYIDLDESYALVIDGIDDI